LSFVLIKYRGKGSFATSSDTKLNIKYPYGNISICQVTKIPIQGAHLVLWDNILGTEIICSKLTPAGNNTENPKLTEKCINNMLLKNKMRKQ
jgi:hypothetical protein